MNRLCEALLGTRFQAAGAIESGEASRPRSDYSERKVATGYLAGFRDSQYIPVCPSPEPHGMVLQNPSLGTWWRSPRPSNSISFHFLCL